MKRSGLALLITAGLVWPAGNVLGQAESLNQCQKAVAKEGGKYIRAVADTVSKCLYKASTAVIVDGGVPGDVAADCVKQLLKITNTASPTKTLSAKFNAKVGKACDPAINPDLAHAEADTYTIGATTLSAANLNTYCQNFGGDGTIGSFNEWRDCIRTAADCQARQGLSLQWPRALEYLADLRAAMANLPASQERDDAISVLTAIETEIEGALEDDKPDLICGQPACGLAGQLCCIGSTCSAGSCADGVCCNSLCMGTCQACTAAAKGSGSDGVCGNISAGTDPDNECVGATTCNGAGACLLADGTTCSLDAECQSGNCVDGVCCNSKCTGTCQACAAAAKGSGADGVCGSIAAGTDPDNECAGATNCNGSGACPLLLADGTACSLNAECQNGNCVDGVCCNTACAGLCQACTAAAKGSGADGVCGNISAGTDPDNECAGATTCNGSGACL